MNIEAYDLDSLRGLVRSLQKENFILKEKLKKANIPFDDENPFEGSDSNMEKYDPDQGGRILHPGYITEDMAKRFYSMFWGREDVFAKRSRSGAYFPQCDNRWKADLCPKMRGEKAVCSECKNQKWTRLE